MKKFIKEFNKQTGTITGDETFIFAYNNPNVFRGTGVATIGDLKQQARLLAGTINSLPMDAKELLFSYLVVDDSETYIATALSFIDQKEKLEKELENKKK